MATVTPEKLRRGFAMMYALGTWTLLGSLAYFHWGGADAMPSAPSLERQDSNIKEHQVEINNSTFSIAITSRLPKDWVPYSTRFYNKVQEIFGSGK